jgi:hypothetical protein
MPLRKDPKMFVNWSIPLDTSPKHNFFSAEQSENLCNRLNVTPCDESLLLCNTSEGGQHLKNNWFWFLKNYFRENSIKE